MTEVVVADRCPGCRSELVFEYAPGEWRLFLLYSVTVEFCPRCGVDLSKSHGWVYDGDTPTSAHPVNWHGEGVA